MRLSVDDCSAQDQGSADRHSDPVRTDNTANDVQLAVLERWS